MARKRSGYNPRFGDFVRARRGDENLESFADQAGVSSQTIGRMQRGYIPPKDSVVSIAQNLQDSVADWLEAAGYPPEDISDDMPRYGPSLRITGETDTSGAEYPLGGSIDGSGRVLPSAEAVEGSSVYVLQATEGVESTELQKGWEAVVDPAGSPTPNQLIVLQVGDNDYQLVRFLRRKQTGIIVLRVGKGHGLSPAVTVEDPHVLGRVVSLREKRR